MIHRKILWGLLLMTASVMAADNGNGNGKSPADGTGKVIHPTKNNTPSSSTTSSPIQYHGGPILLGTPKAYYIWYGTWTDNSPTILQNLAQTIGNSPYFQINTTYSSSAGTVSGNVAWGGYTNDNYSHGSSLTDASVQAIVSSALSSGRLPIDPNGIYFVLTSADVNETSGFCTNYCGWHSSATISGTDIKYAFIGDAARCPSACAAQTTTPNGNLGADSMASIISHELEEAVTDPDANAWYDAQGYENADKCAWTFGTAYTTANGSYANMNLGGLNYLIQQNWVNSGSGFCALNYTQSADTTPPTVSITSPVANTTILGTVTVSANATDNVAVASVQFQLDGVNLGPNLTAAPYSISWDTTTTTNGSHVLTAIARDTSGNSATSASLTVTVSNTVSAPPTSGLIGYWNFDEGSGSIAHDSSGSGYNGTINNATWTSGKTNFALSFSGANSVVAPTIALGQTFSVSAWVNPAAVPEGGYVRIAETQYNGGLYLGTNGDGSKYQFIINTGSGSTGSCGVAYGCAVGGTVAAGWHLVTGTFDGTTAKLYADTVLVSSDTFTAPANTNFHLYIGQFYGGGYGWHGVLDEVRLYNRALSSVEISAIYNYTGSTTPDTTPPTVSITAPAGNITVSGTVSISANTSDNVAVSYVQFQLDGVNLGADITTAPYSISWDTTTASNGSHTLTAIARDTSQNTTISAPITVTVSNPVSSPPTSGLIGYWNFDEASGNIAHDTSGSGYNGTINNATWTSGKINSALSFSGAGSVVTPDIALGQTFSVSAWVNPAAVPERGYLRIAETRYNGGLYLGMNANGSEYQFIVNTGSGSTGSCGVAYGCAVGGTVAAGWHLVTGTYDGTTAKLYVDAVLIASDTFTPPANTDFPLYIGQYYGGGYAWNGILDEVRLYNRALTATEVNSIYTQ